MFHENNRLGTLYSTEKALGPNSLPSLRYGHFMVLEELKTIIGRQWDLNPMTSQLKGPCSTRYTKCKND